MEQATDGAETAAIDGLVSSWSERLKTFLFDFVYDTRIRIYSVMRPRSSRGRNSSASVTVTVTVSWIWLGTLRRRKEKGNWKEGKEEMKWEKKIILNKFMDTVLFPLFSLLRLLLELGVTHYLLATLNDWFVQLCSVCLLRLCSASVNLWLTWSPKFIFFFNNIKFNNKIMIIINKWAYAATSLRWSSKVAQAEFSLFSWMGSAFTQPTLTVIKHAPILSSLFWAYHLGLCMPKHRFFGQHFCPRCRSNFNHFDVIGPQSYRSLKNNANNGHTPFVVIQGHWFRYQSKARMRRSYVWIIGY